MKTQALQEKLLHWFAEKKRDLPWRENYDPYQVWISEIMLQQTQVKTVLPYFDRWMKRLPSLKAVAKADEETLLKLWEGLGYYSRIRNIQKTARFLIEENQGEFPSDFGQLKKLPGVGPYTAAAIASIAFERDHAVVDGNVIRVLSRLYNFSDNTRLPKNQKVIQKMAENLLPPGQARNFNQAMMELGALICTPKKPDCPACPIQKECLAYKLNKQHRLPNRGPTAKKIAIQVAIAVLFQDDKIFIQKRPAEGLMPGLWEFPGGQLESGETPEIALKRELFEELDVKITKIKPLMTLKHSYTKFKVQLHCFTAEIQSGSISVKAAQGAKWVTPIQLKNYAFPAANGRIIQTLISRLK